MLNDLSLIHVPSAFPAKGTAKLAFIGEAPSDEETMRLEPLVGPSGRVFNAMLRNANIDRDEIFISNAFDQRIPGDTDREIDQNRALWLKDDVRVAENAARLNEELERVQPNVIVPLGATALWAFTGVGTGISKYRGAATAATRIRVGAKLIPTYHPAYVIRNWQSLSIVVGDFIKASAEADLGPRIIYPRLEIYVEPTLDDIREWVPEWKSARKLSVDIETGWGQITGIGFAPSATRAMAIPFVDLRKTNKSYWKDAKDEMEVWKIVRDVLESPVPKVGQNYTYDLFWLLKQRGIRTRAYRSDTRLRHKVLYPELPADLATMSATYTRVGSYKMWGGRYQKNEGKTDG